MKFVVIGIDGPEGQEKRGSLRPAHLERLEQMDLKGKVVMAGPFSDRSGSLIILEVDSVDEARAFMEGDPYVKNGVFERLEIRPFTQVFPRENTGS